MPPRKSPPVPPPSPVRTPDERQLDIARLKRRIAELEAFDPHTVTRRFKDPGVIALQTAIDEALSTTFGHGTTAYDRYSAATRLDSGPVRAQLDPMFGGNSGGPDPREAQQYVAEGKDRALGLLRQAVRGLEEDLADHASLSLTVNAPPTQASVSREVFIVHGHDEGAREAVARFLEQIGFVPIILHEQANKGRTVIEKVEAHGAVAFAVVILTPDDEGGLRGGPHSPRARQNVVLELGYFVGRLGRENVCALKRGDVEIPSDFGGVVYQSFDDAGAWKQALARELQAAGHEIDWNKVMR
jgi:predicted nucleotide-binding protein